MIYSVAPRDCDEELYAKLVEYYSDDPNVTVIVDRRHSERRSRGRTSADDRQRRIQRDRRRARVVGEVRRVATVDG
jgi:ribosomal protein L15E